jgi:hypothetical protein
MIEHETETKSFSMKEKSPLGKFVQNLLDKYWNDGVLVTNPRNGKKMIIPEGVVMTNSKNEKKIMVPENRLKDPSYMENIWKSLDSINDTPTTP